MPGIFPYRQGAEVPACETGLAQVMGDTPRHDLELAVAHHGAIRLNDGRPFGFVAGEQMGIEGEIHRWGGPGVGAWSRPR